MDASKCGIVPSLDVFARYLKKICTDLCRAPDFPFTIEECTEIINIAKYNQKCLESDDMMVPSPLYCTLSSLVSNQTPLYDYGQLENDQETVGEKNVNMLKTGTTEETENNTLVITSIIQACKHRNLHLPVAILDTFDRLAEIHKPYYDENMRVEVQALVCNNEDLICKILRAIIIKCCLYNNKLGNDSYIQSWPEFANATMVDVFLKQWLQSWGDTDEKNVKRLCHWALQSFILTYNFMQSDRHRMSYPCATLSIQRGYPEQTKCLFDRVAADNVGIGMNLFGLDNSRGKANFMAAIKPYFKSILMNENEHRSSGATFSLNTFDVNMNHTDGILQNHGITKSVHISYILDRCVVRAFDGQDVTTTLQFAPASSTPGFTKKAFDFMGEMVDTPHFFEEMRIELTSAMWISWQPVSYDLMELFNLPREARWTELYDMLIFEVPVRHIMDIISRNVCTGHGYYVCDAQNIHYRHRNCNLHREGADRIAPCGALNLCQEVVQQSWDGQNSLCALSSLNLSGLTPLELSSPSPHVGYRKNLTAIAVDAALQLIEIIDKLGRDCPTNDTTLPIYRSAQVQAAFAISLIGTSPIVQSGFLIDGSRLHELMLDIRVAITKAVEEQCTEQYWLGLARNDRYPKNPKENHRLHTEPGARFHPRKVMTQAPASRAAVINGTKGVVPGLDMMITANPLVITATGQSSLYTTPLLLIMAASNERFEYRDAVTLCALMSGKNEVPPEMRDLAARCEHMLNRFSSCSLDEQVQAYGDLAKTLQHSISTYYRFPANAPGDENHRSKLIIENIVRRSASLMANLLYYPDTSQCDIVRDAHL